MNDYILRKASRRGVSHERSGRENEDRTINFQTDEYIWLGVFDGVSEGGGGAFAASIAGESMLDILRVEEPDSVLDTGFAIFKRAQESILKMNREHPEYGEMRTTGAVVCIDRLNHMLYWFSIGDSAIFLFRKHRLLKKLTIEDTDIGVLLAEGKISRKAASRATLGHELNRWLGMNAHSDTIESYVRAGSIKLHRKDSILLCTDGLYSKLSPKTLTRLLRGYVDPESLIKAAINSGSEDDISFIHAIPNIECSTTLVPLKLVIASMILMFSWGLFIGAAFQCRLKEKVEKSRLVIQEMENAKGATDSLTIIKTYSDEGI